METRHRYRTKKHVAHEGKIATPAFAKDTPWQNCLHSVLRFQRVAAELRQSGKVDGVSAVTELDAPGINGEPLELSLEVACYVPDRGIGE